MFTVPYVVLDAAHNFAAMAKDMRPGLDVVSFAKRGAGRMRAVVTNDKHAEVITWHGDEVPDKYLGLFYVDTDSLPSTSWYKEPLVNFDPDTCQFVQGRQSWKVDLRPAGFKTSLDAIFEVIPPSRNEAAACDFDAHKLEAVFAHLKRCLEAVKGEGVRTRVQTGTRSTEAARITASGRDRKSGIEVEVVHILMPLKEEG